jgi:hypothetical protein
VSGRYKPKRFLHAIRCRLNLSSGEKRAGCALSVLFLSGVSFCRGRSNQEVNRLATRYDRSINNKLVIESDSPYLQCVDALAFVIEIIHQMHVGTYSCFIQLRYTRRYTGSPCLCVSEQAKKQPYLLVPYRTGTIQESSKQASTSSRLMAVRQW